MKKLNLADVTEKPADHIATMQIHYPTLKGNVLALDFFRLATKPENLLILESFIKNPQLLESLRKAAQGADVSQARHLAFAIAEDFGKHT